MGSTLRLACLGRLIAPEKYVEEDGKRALFNRGEYDHHYAVGVSNRKGSMPPRKIC